MCCSPSLRTTLITTWTVPLLLSMNKLDKCLPWTNETISWCQKCWGPLPSVISQTLHSMNQQVELQCSVGVTGSGRRSISKYGLCELHILVKIMYSKYVLSNDLDYLRKQLTLWYSYANSNISFIKKLIFSVQKLARPFLKRVLDKCILNYQMCLVLINKAIKFDIITSLNAN